MAAVLAVASPAPAPGSTSSPTSTPTSAVAPSLNSTLSESLNSTISESPNSSFQSLNSTISESPNSTVAQSPPPLPARMECFKALRVVGEGTYGKVTLAVNKDKPDEFRAVKHIKATAVMLQHILNEAYVHRFVSQTPHENVIRMYQLSKVKANFYFCMEYADDSDLFDKIEEDVGLPVEKAQDYFRQLFAGLEFLHDLGVAHRDIKPDNLLLTKTGVLKISDFGMAEVFRKNGVETLFRGMCGTEAYAPPEVLGPRPYKPALIDVWSSGVTLLSMLTGCLPWERADDSSAEYLNFADKTSIDEEPWSRLDVHALDLVQKMLTPKPESRATLKVVKSHIWFTQQLGKNLKRKLEVTDDETGNMSSSPDAKKTKSP